MGCETLNKAIMLLEKADNTCVLCGRDVVLTDKRRGIRPLLDLLETGTDVSGFSVADKVVGKAAAFLYCLLKIGNLYAGVISQPALEVLRTHGIETEYGQLVEAIRNRTDDGFCPMERAVWEIDNPGDALPALQAALAKLQK